MKRFELKISLYDWFFVLIIAVFFASSINVIIYLVLKADWKEGIFVGSILGFCMALFSTIFISINNKYILPKISKPILWWIISAFFSFFAGFIGFYGAFHLAKTFSLSIPESILKNRNTIAFISGFLNYLMGLIIYLFVSMRGKMEEIENLLLKGRMLSLQIQLNSHFLYNVINNIAELIKIDGNKAEEALIKLSRFLRRVMQEEDIIPISKELENVKSYVELENLRYDGMINLNISGEREAKDFLIPRFSVQLLVENAIKHGFQGKTLNIKISFFNISKSSCFISVSNDGKKIENLKFGMGLDNLSKRLKILSKGEIKLADASKNEFIIKLKK